jgi:hypothetical protein
MESEGRTDGGGNGREEEREMGEGGSRGGDS